MEHNSVIVRGRKNRRFVTNCFDSLEVRDLLASVIPSGYVKQYSAISLVKPDYSNQNISITFSENNQKIPIDELTDTYKGLTGGLYPDGTNQPNGDLALMARASSDAVIPLKTNGQPSLTTGKVGFLAIGQSTTRMCFETFQKMSKNLKSNNVRLINAAQDGKILQDWAYDYRPWGKMMSILKKNSVSKNQVQVVWLESALLNPKQYGTGLNHIKVQAELTETVIKRLISYFPNLKTVYCSSRYYAGYTNKETSPEPYAYESGFAIRELIKNQFAKINSLTSQEVTEINPPLVLWGPYYWANGASASKSDGLNWLISDLESDGIHPSTSGKTKVAQQLLDFFTKDPFASTWFRKKPIPNNNPLLENK